MNAKRYHLATFGCQMNEYDSRMIASGLESHGLEETSEPSGADVIVVNTCSVRENAETSAYERIRNLAHLKRARPGLKIAVIGCMAQNHRERILKELPFVDLVAGPDNYSELESRLLDAAMAPMAARASATKPSKVIAQFDSVENYLGRSAKRLSSFSSHVTVQRGCNKKCAFGIVPFVRGAEKCRDPQDILREVRELTDQGVREVTLLGQTVNSWRYGGDTFASLLMQVASLPGIERIRFTSPHPRHFTDDLIWAMTHEPRICRHAHLPLQSGSDRILKQMRRQYDRHDYMAIIAKLRDADPHFGITTDLIAGFPGETENEFAETLSAINEAQFDSAFLFAYSPREGTESFSFREDITPEQKGERLQRMVDLQNFITRKRALAAVGRTETVLVEGPSFRNAFEWVGKTDNFRKVILPAGTPVQPGSLVDARIVSVKGWTLRGEALLNSVR